jgi:hypothetical protein
VCRVPDVGFRETRSTKTLRLVCRKILLRRGERMLRPPTRLRCLCEFIEINCGCQEARKSTSSDSSLGVFVGQDYLYNGRPCWQCECCRFPAACTDCGRSSLIPDDPMTLIQTQTQFAWPGQSVPSCQLARPLHRPILRLRSSLCSISNSWSSHR